jgi:hypothetical protein
VKSTVSSSGVVRKAAVSAPRQVITSLDVQDPEKLARTLQEQRRDLDALDAPKREIVYEDVAVGSAGALVTLTHNFGGRVLWSVEDWTSTAGGATHILEKSTTTTADALVLASSVAGTATIRIEAAG